MKNLAKIMMISAVAAFFFSCDKIEAPFVEKQNIDTTVTLKRKVLLEDYTGHQCVYCPAANQKAQELKELYGENLIVLTVHAGFYALTNPTGKFSYDFRCQAGNELDNFFQISAAGNPKGMVNRLEVSGNRILEKDAWGSTVAGVIHLVPDANIQITNNYNTSSRLLNITVQSTFLTDLQGDYMLCVYITEDSIVNWQKTLTGDDPDYVHRHVLRGAVNSTWGDTVAVSQVTNGQVVNKSYSITLDTEWNDAQCSVVAFIYRKSDYVVIQAEEEHVK